MEFWVLMLLWIHGFVVGALVGVLLERRKKCKGDINGKNS